MQRSASEGTELKVGQAAARQPLLATVSERPLGTSACAFVLAAAFTIVGMRFNPGLDGASSLWLTSPVWIGMLLVAAYPVWPRILLAGLLGTLSPLLVAGAGLDQAIALLVSCTVGVLVGAAGFRRFLDRSSEIFDFWFVASAVGFLLIAAPVLTAMGIVVSTQLIGVASHRTGIAGLWATHALGVLTLLPLYLCFRTQEWRAARGLRPFCILSALLLVGGTLFIYSQPGLPPSLLILPLVVLVVFRSGMVGAAFASVLVSAVTVVATEQGLGPFSGLSAPPVLLAHAFVALSISIALGTAYALLRQDVLLARLQSAEASRDLIADHLPARIAHIDTSMQLKFSNRAWREAARPEMSCMDTLASESISELDRLRSDPRLAQALAGQTVKFRSTRKHGDQIRHEQCSFVPERTDNGAVDGVYSVAVDVTSIKNAEQQLQRSRWFLQSIAENIPALIAYVDRNLTFQFVNRQQLELLNRELAEVEGRSARDLMPTALIAKIESHLAVVLEQGQRAQFEWEFESLDGKRFFLTELIPDLQADGEIAGLYLLSVDISTRKEVEIRQALLEDQFRAIAEAAPGLIIYLDGEGRIRYANRLLQVWFGVSPDAVAGSTLDQVAAGRLDQSQVQNVERAISGQRFEVEAEVQDESGNSRNLLVHYVPHRGADRELLGVYLLATDVTPLKQVQIQLEKHARYDVLTGIPNRRECMIRLEAALNRAERRGEPITLMFIDIDFFKAVNDTYGHATGDEVLQEVALRLKESVRSSDSVARFAGDEFVIVFESLKSIDEAHFVARKILSSIAQPFVCDKVELEMSVSLGVAWETHPQVHPERLLDTADRALYAAKADGRNTYHLSIDAMRNDPVPVNDAQREAQSGPGVNTVRSARAG